MKRLLVLVLILVASNITFSQSENTDLKNSLNCNNISLNIGSALIINGIGLKYERLIPRKKVYYTLMGVFISIELIFLEWKIISPYISVTD